MQIRVSIIVSLMFLGFLLMACSMDTNQQPTSSSENFSSIDLTIEESLDQQTHNSMEDTMTNTTPVTITAAGQTLQATFYDNETAQAILTQFPMTLAMMDLYDREMCYRFEEALPATNTTSSGFEVGDIAYWAPRHSFVIFYRQNAEVIDDMQIVGHIDEGVELFTTTGDTNVTFSID